MVGTVHCYLSFLLCIHHFRGGQSDNQCTPRSQSGQRYPKLAMQSLAGVGWRGLSMTWRKNLLNTSWCFHFFVRFFVKKIRLWKKKHHRNPWELAHGQRSTCRQETFMKLFIMFMPRLPDTADTHGGPDSAPLAEIRAPIAAQSPPTNFPKKPQKVDIAASRKQQRETSSRWTWKRWFWPWKCFLKGSKKGSTTGTFFLMGPKKKPTQPSNLGREKLRRHADTQFRMYRLQHLVERWWNGGTVVSRGDGGLPKTGNFPSSAL